MAEKNEVLELKEKLAAAEKDKQALLDKETARKNKERRYWAKQAVILNKAQKQGITATDAEIDAYVKAHYK